MNKSNTKTVLVLLVFLGGTFAFAPITQAQIDFSVLDKWKVPGSQKPSIESTTPDADSPKTERPREQSAKEMQKAREQAERLLATIRQKLSKPEPAAAVTWSNTAVHVDVSGGYLNTPPSPAGVFAALAAGTAKTPATSISSVALRRTLAILARAFIKDGKGNGNLGSPEEAAVLAGEAANAMAGGELRIRVDDSEFKWNEHREELFRAVLQEAEKSYRDIEFAKTERVRVDEEVMSIVNAVREGTLTAEKAESNIKALSDTLETVLKRSTEAHTKIRDLPKIIERVVEQ
jgi:ElaB/YqjD/DUF883 family membrane-anchored ribosome-binding protein